MKMVRSHNGTKPRFLSDLAPPQQLRRMELLEHRRVTYGARWFHGAPFDRSSASQHFNFFRLNISRSVKR
jgi:hypothetical protein